MVVTDGLDGCHPYCHTGSQPTRIATLCRAAPPLWPPQAGQLATLLRCNDLVSHVNLIPWNPVDESEFKRPAPADVKAFVKVGRGGWGGQPRG